MPREILKISFSETPFSCDLSDQTLILSLKYGLYSCNFLTKMHLGNLLLSLYHAAKTKRCQNLKLWKSSNKIYLKVVMGQMGR